MFDYDFSSVEKEEDAKVEKTEKSPKKATHVKKPKTRKGVVVGLRKVSMIVQFEDGTTDFARKQDGVVIGSEVEV